MKHFHDPAALKTTATRIVLLILFPLCSCDRIEVQHNGDISMQINTQQDVDELFVRAVQECKASTKSRVIVEGDGRDVDSVKTMHRYALNYKRAQHGETVSVIDNNVKDSKGDDCEYVRTLIMTREMSLFKHHVIIRYEVCIRDTTSYGPVTVLIYDEEQIPRSIVDVERLRQTLNLMS